MPVRRLGPWCERCGERPADQDGICRPCEALLRAFGHQRGPRVVACDEPEFEAELRRWLDAA